MFSTDGTTNVSLLDTDLETDRKVNSISADEFEQLVVDLKLRKDKEFSIPEINSDPVIQEESPGDKLERICREKMQRDQFLLSASDNKQAVYAAKYTKTVNSGLSVKLQRQLNVYSQELNRYCGQWKNYHKTVRNDLVKTRKLSKSERYLRIQQQRKKNTKQKLERRNTEGEEKIKLPQINGTNSSSRKLHRTLSDQTFYSSTFITGKESQKDRSNEVQKSTRLPIIRHDVDNDKSTRERKSSPVEKVELPHI